MGYLSTYRWVKVLKVFGAKADLTLAQNTSQPDRLPQHELFMRRTETIGTHYSLMETWLASPQAPQVGKLVPHHIGFDVTTPSGAIFEAAILCASWQAFHPFYFSAGENSELKIFHRVCDSDKCLEAVCLNGLKTHQVIRACVTALRWWFCKKLYKICYRWNFLFASLLLLPPFLNSLCFTSCSVYLFIHSPQIFPGPLCPIVLVFPLSLLCLSPHEPLSI